MGKVLRTARDKLRKVTAEELSQEKVAHLVEHSGLALSVITNVYRTPEDPFEELD